MGGGSRCDSLRVGANINGGSKCDSLRVGVHIDGGRLVLFPGNGEQGNSD